jgi:hypothetical protein
MQINLVSRACACASPRAARVSGADRKEHRMHEQHDELYDQDQPAAEPVEVEQVHASKYVSEQDLAMYAAITGRRPVVEIVRERPAMSIGHVVGEGPHGLRSIFSSARNHQKVTVWIRNASMNARRKIGEAAMRLAS